MGIAGRAAKCPFRAGCGTATIADKAVGGWRLANAGATLVATGALRHVGSACQRFGAILRESNRSSPGQNAERGLHQITTALS